MTTEAIFFGMEKNCKCGEKITNIRYFLTEQTMMTTQANLWTAFSPSMKYRTPWTVDSCANKLSGDKQSIQCCPEKHVKWRIYQNYNIWHKECRDLFQKQIRMKMILTRWIQIWIKQQKKYLQVCRKVFQVHSFPQTWAWTTWMWKKIAMTVEREFEGHSPLQPLWKPLSVSKQDLEGTLSFNDWHRQCLWIECVLPPLDPGRLW